MSWLLSLLIAAVSGVLGLVGAGFIGNLCVEWYRISGREGAAGYFVVAIALLGGLLGFVIGLVAVRLVAAGGTSDPWKGLGAACGSVFGVAVVALGLCRLLADLPPEMDGRALEVAVEVRCPAGFTLPDTLDAYGATAEVYLPRGRRLPGDELRLDEARKVDGHWVVPATVPLTTSVKDKYLLARIDSANSLLFPLRLPSQPSRSDMEWSDWVASGWDVGKPEPPEEAKFRLRWRVQLVEPEPPAPDPETVRAAEFAALGPDPTLAQLLPFLFVEPDDERTAIVTAAIRERPLELALLIHSSDVTMREFALQATSYLETPPAEVVEAVLAEGRSIAEAIRTFKAMTSDDPTFLTVRGDLNSRFNYWKRAWWTIHQRIGVDGRPPVKEIHDLTIGRESGDALDEIEVNARVILEALDKPATPQSP